jgi:hypothetical protein
MREPLVHFLVLGAAIFAAYSTMARNTGGEPGNIVVSQGQLASMREAYIRTWQRPPTPEEWKGLVRDQVKEEVYYREALAMGLDKDDVVIRRRLRQKLEFITDDIAAQTQPTEEDLKAYLEAHPDKFRTEDRFTFRQLYLSPARHGENLERDATRLLATLNGPGGEASFETSGDPSMLEREFTELPAGEVSKQFGEQFTLKLSELTPGRWQGPVESGLGVHVVFLAKRTPGGVPAFDAVRDAVTREWDHARRLEANEKVYREMLARYTITIEDPAMAKKE